MDVGGAQFNGILKDLVDEANDRRFILGSGVEVGILSVFIDDLDRFLLVECLPTGGRKPGPMKRRNRGRRA